MLWLPKFRGAGRDPQGRSATGRGSSVLIPFPCHYRLRYANKKPPGLMLRGSSARMKTALKEMVAAATVADIPVQSASQDIWSTKYRLMAKDGTVVDETMDDT